MSARGSVPRVRAVVLNYNGGTVVRRCIEHLLATDWPEGYLEVVVVDNSSDDGSDVAVERAFPTIRVVRSGANRGFPANNLAMRDLDDIDYVALVNNDAFVSRDWLVPLVDALESDPYVGAACPKILFEPTFVDVSIRSPMFSLGGTDPRRLGVRVSGVQVEGEDRWSDVQFADGFWGVEQGQGDETVFQWTNGEGLLRVPVAETDVAGGKARIRIAAPGVTDVVLTCGEPEVRSRVSAHPEWIDVPLAGEQFDVVNNVGGIVLDDGSGADRGYMQRDDGRYDEARDVFNWCGAGVLFRRAYLRDVGLFDERFFMYYEDTDLSWRGQARAWRYRYVPSSVVRHIHAATSVEGSSLFAHYVERNRLLMLLKNAPFGLVAGATVRFILATGSYARGDVLFQLALFRKPRTLVVGRRIRSFLDYLRLVPVMFLTRIRLRRRQLLEDAAITATRVELR